MKQTEPTLPSDCASALRIYRALFPLAMALMLPSIVLRMLRRGNAQAGFSHRLGFFTPEEKEHLKQRRWIWIRSISVGETLVALKLARALHASESSLGIILSTTTSTGHAIAAEAAEDWLFPIYNPLDARGIVERALNVVQPLKLVLIEGEVWPNLMAACAERRIPVLLANARLSQRSAARFAKFRTWTAPFFRLLRWVGVPDEADAARWAHTGVSSDRITITGSIKFDQDSNHQSRGAALQELLLSSGVPENAPILVAGSTHDGEEAILLQCFHKWRKSVPGLRLLIAPRHVERVPSLLSELAPHKLHIARRTQLPNTEAWEVLLLDTTGELRDWYGLATVAFVGKSLTAHGGQNPVEPALAGKPVVFGPHMENFESVVNLLLAHKGASQVSNAGELLEVIHDLLRDKAARRAMGMRAIEAVKRHQGSTSRTAAAILAQEPGSFA